MHQGGLVVGAFLLLTTLAVHSLGVQARKSGHGALGLRAMMSSPYLGLGLNRYYYCAGHSIQSGGLVVGSLLLLTTLAVRSLGVQATNTGHRA